MVKLNLSWATVDRFYRAFVYSRFFNKGWGTPDNMRRLFEMRATFADVKRREAFLLEDHPINIVKESKSNGLVYLEGEFMSPLYVYHPKLFEPPVERAKFEMVIPEKWRGPLKPMCIHMAGTGDHHYWRRRFMMCKPLALQHGIGSINLVNPYYGERKPKDQFASCLKNVTDLFVMGGSLIFEGMTLLNWCSRQGFGPLCLTGISMGGHMASLAAGHWPQPVAVVPCLSWSTASQCFTEGVLSKALNWEALKDLYYSPNFQRELAKEMSFQYHSKDYGLGRYFAAHYEAMTEGQVPFRWSRHVGRTVAKSSAVLKDVEVLDFMCGIMDEFTHLANYPRPVDTSLVIAVEALHDAVITHSLSQSPCPLGRAPHHHQGRFEYIPREGVMDLRELWPECEVRYYDSGHITGCLLHTHRFRQAIVDALEKVREKYYSGPQAAQDAGAESKTASEPHPSDPSPQSPSKPHSHVDNPA